MLTLVLTRHGHTDRSEPDQYLGQRIDVPLSVRGRADAAHLRDRLATVSFHRAISSPLLRARETARILVPSQDIELDARLMEADYGDWEGHTVEMLEARWPDHRAAWIKDPARIGPPHGENGHQIARRARSFLRQLVADEAEAVAGPGDRLVLVVGHSTLNRVLLTVALGVPTIDYRRRFRQDWLNLTLLHLGADGRGLLVLANDTAHLRPPDAAPWP